MSDHPDIEKLPLEIDGIPVRETIREIFRNPENGTPDNISKAGCLALALKSNEVGGPARGYMVWNAWRGFFLAKKRDLNTYQWINQANFSNYLFDGKPINFSCFLFGNGASFENSEWSYSAKFTLASFGNFTNFSNTRWMHEADFRGARWESISNFDEAKFEGDANFNGSQWAGDLNFHRSKWLGKVDFSGSQLGNDADFTFSQWLEMPDFSGCNFEVLESIYANSTDFKLAKSWAGGRGLSSNSFMEIDFSGSRFEAGINFSNRKFLGETKFGIFSEGNQSLKTTFFLLPPIFHGCELHQDTSFEGAAFPQATGSDFAVRAYRTLKLAFNKQQAVREEQQFFRLEMEEETLSETGLKRLLFQAYKTFSDYGFSIARPLKYGGLGVLVLTALYGLLSWLGQCGLSVQACHFAPQWLEFSLLQTLPLPGLDKLSEAASKAFWPQGAWCSFGLSALVILHKTLSLAVLFLIGLALRNLFKLK
jgi:hypothetical protein